ncbi:MAG: Ig-like domain-containing protein, partial [Gallionella sp.]
PSNEVLVKDVIAPTTFVGGVCVPPGATVQNATVNGQIKITFSEPMDAVSAETTSNYTATNLGAATLSSPTLVVLDFTAPISCAGPNAVTLGSSITDVAGNALTGNLVHVIP